MPRKSSDFRREATKVPYDLELADGTVVIFQDPNRLTTKSAFELSQNNDPEKTMRLLLGKDWAAFWSEYSERPQDETNATLEDVFAYYGADKSNGAASR